LVRLISNGWILRRLADVVLPEFLRSYPGVTLRLLAKDPTAPSRTDATISLWFEAPPKKGDTAIPLGLCHSRYITRLIRIPIRLIGFRFTMKTHRIVRLCASGASKVRRARHFGLPPQMPIWYMC